MTSKAKTLVLVIAIFTISMIPNNGYSEKLFSSPSKWHYYTGKGRALSNIIKKISPYVVSIVGVLLPENTDSSEKEPENARSSERKNQNPQSTERNYSIDMTSNTDSNIKINGLKITDGYVTVMFLYKNRKYHEEKISIHPSISNKSIFIYSKNLDRRFKWISTDETIPVFPEKRTMKKWQQLEFHIKFQRIDDDMNTFHIIEGDIEDPSQEHRWNFYNINLAVKE